MAATADFVHFLLCPITPWRIIVSSPNFTCISHINIQHHLHMIEVILKNKMAAKTEIINFADSAFSNDVTHFKRKPLEVSSQNFAYSYIMAQGRLVLNFAHILKTRWPPQPILCIFFFAQLLHGELLYHHQI